MSSQIQSPGNELFPDSPPMRMPHMKFLYRLECMTETSSFEVGAPHAGGFERSIVNITGGTFKGPELEGEVLPGGADWAQAVKGTHSNKLDARYVGRTTDGEYLYITAKGLYRPGPDTQYAASTRTNTRAEYLRTATQDDVEFFSHLTIEAGAGKYNWVNGLVVLGVMTCVGERIIIDAYYLTNFPDRHPESVLAVMDA